MSGFTGSQYSITPPDGAKPVRHTRATTVAGALDDPAGQHNGLVKWFMRHVARGVAARQDLRIKVASAQSDDIVNKVCAEILEAAGGGATIGTVLHDWTERIDRGELLDRLETQEFTADLDAYQTALRVFGVETFPQYVERVCVNYKLPERLAGTIDRIVRFGGVYYIADIKTGAKLMYQWPKIAIQLAIYANADHLVAADGTVEEMPAVSRTDGLVFHLPAGTGRCDLYRVDVAAGWEAAQLALGARAWRKRRDLAFAIRRKG